MTKRLFVSFVIVMAALATSAWAGQSIWTDASSAQTHLWSDGYNWNDFVGPDSSYEAVIDMADPCQVHPCIINEGTAAESAYTWVGFSQRPCYLNITGGTLVTPSLRVGVDNGTGIVNISGGAVTVNGDTSIGQGANGIGNIDMTDGSLTVTGTAYLYVGFGGGSGTINLKGGNLTAFALSMNEDGHQVVDLSGGTLEITDNAAGRFNEVAYQIGTYYFGKGWVTAYGGKGTLSITENPVTHNAIVVGVPPVCWPVPTADLNGDCSVDFNDFAILAQQWLTCNKTDGTCL